MLSDQKLCYLARLVKTLVPEPLTSPQSLRFVFPRMDRSVLCSLSGLGSFQLCHGIWLILCALCFSDLPLVFLLKLVHLFISHLLLVPAQVWTLKPWNVQGHRALYTSTCQTLCTILCTTSAGAHLQVCPCAASVSQQILRHLQNVR